MERDNEKRESEKRTLRMHEETRKRREHLDIRRRERKDEITDLKQYQESHLAELNSHNKESEKLCQTEAHLRRSLAAIQNEQQLVHRNIVLRAERFTAQGPSNVRRIKQVLRNRSEAICADLREDIALIDRLEIGMSTEQICLLHNTFKAKHEEEKHRQFLVEAMYESEAKQHLATQERIWADEETIRGQKLSNIIAGHLKAVQDMLSANLDQQRQILRMKETHLSAIQVANDRLKDLMNDQRKDEVEEIDIGSSNGNREMARSGGANGGLVDSMRKCSIGSLGSATSLSSELSVPKYGRKKIAWN